MKDLVKEDILGLAEFTMVPSLNSLDLERSSLSDYRYRLAPRGQILSELYHENSKLNEFNKDAIICDTVLINEIKNWHLTTTCKVKEADIDRGKSSNFFKAISSLPTPIQQLLSHLFKKQPVESIYSMDILLLYDSNIYRVIPMDEYLILEKSFKDMYPFSSAILDGNNTEFPLAIGYMVIVGMPWRRMVFDGQRGYRNMLLEAGMLLEKVSQADKENYITIRIHNNFYDNQVNRFLNLDGVESYVLSIVSLSERKAE